MNSSGDRSILSSSLFKRSKVYDFWAWQSAPPLPYWFVLMETRSIEALVSQPQDRFSFSSLVLGEEYANDGVRVILQFHGTTDTTTISPQSSVSYLNNTENLESKTK